MLYYMFNKPSGCVTARRDDRFKTVMDFFPDELHYKLHPVGRLDKDTEGLLIVTDDGRLDEYLLRPERQVKKRYFFWALGEPNEQNISTMEAGVLLKGKDGTTLPSKIEVENTCKLCDIEKILSIDHHDKLMKNPTASAFSGTICISEGKRHEIKRIFSSVRYAIVYLKRISIGGLKLDDDLPLGEYKQLSNGDLSALGYGFVGL